MTRLLKLLAIAPLLLVSLPAQADEGDWYVAPSIVWFNDDPDRALDESLAGVQVTVGRNLTQYLSLEGLLGYSDIKAYCDPVDCYPDQKHLDFSANLLAFYDRDATFTPYFLLGIGYLGVDADEGPQYVRNTGSDNRSTASAGIGLKWQPGQSNYSIRGEYRHRTAFGDPRNLNDQLLTIGVQYSFGDGSDSSIPVVAASAPEPVAYQDSDHVTDDRDRCPGTVAGAKVDLDGCEIQEIIDLKNIYFGFDSDVLHLASMRLLDQSASILSRHPDLQVEIAGYADILGPERYNMRLSQRRAEVVRAYLEQASVNPANLKVRGYGESNSATHAANRRVELRITKP